MKKGLLVVVMCLVAVALSSQSIEIAGHIKSSRQEAIVAATVTLSGFKKPVISDSLGFFLFKGVTAGVYKLNVSAAGNKLLLTSVRAGNQNVLLNLIVAADTLMEDEVVISGTLKAVNKLSSPIPVEVYSPSFFKKNPAPNIFESLTMVNGVQPQLNCNVCNTGDIHINGMEGPYTMILIDGMPIVSSLATVYGLAGIPNSMVKRIEIVKGPAAALYGSEAVGGLINIITKDAGSAELLKIDLSATHFGEINADVTAAKQFEKASTLLGVNYFNYQQKRDINHDNFTDLTLQERLSVFNKWNFKFASGRSASLGIRYVTENRWGGELQWRPAFRGSDSVYGEAIVTNRFELLGTTAISKSIKADLSYNYHLQDSYYGTVKFFAKQQVLFTQLRWNKVAGKHDLLAGFPLRCTFYDDNTIGTAGINGKNKPSNMILSGIFLQDEWKAGQRLVMLTGLRYDYNNLHGSIVTPRLSFKYSNGGNHTIRVGGGNGYRTVSLFTEDHAALTGARQVVIAHALRPEQSWNGNINYTGIFRHTKGFINIDVSAFYTYFTNKIVGDFLTDPDKIIYDNLKGHAVSKGITINTDFNFTSGLKIIAGATFMNVYQADKNGSGNTVITKQLFAPAFSSTFAVSYLWIKPKLGIDFTGRVNGPMYLPVVPGDFRPATSPLHSILNIQLTRTFSNIELYTGVKNLLNFIPADPLLHPDDPFNKKGGKYFDESGNARPATNPYGYQFDPSYNFAPVQGAKLYLGFRWKL